MKRATTLKENYEFRRVYHRGQSGVSPFLVLYARPNRGKRNRLGITVSAKLGCAVTRNRVRRRLREIYRLAQPELSQGYDVVLVARGRAPKASYRELETAFRRCCDKLGLFKPLPPLKGEVASAVPRKADDGRGQPVAGDNPSGASRQLPFQGSREIRRTSCLP